MRVCHTGGRQIGEGEISQKQQPVPETYAYFIKVIDIIDQLVIIKIIDSGRWVLKK
jgi:hypothetical protein